MARVLVVDDEKDFRFVARVRLEVAGHEVLEAGDGLEALGVVAEVDDLDVVITDDVMPGLGGEDLRRRLGELRPGLPVHVWSCISQPSRSILPKRAGGAVALVTAPAPHPDAASRRP